MNTMETYGAAASRLAQTIADRERDLHLLKGFKEAGGQHRIGISCDHPDPEIAAAIARTFHKRNLTELLMSSIIKIAAAEVESAKADLKLHVYGPHISGIGGGE